MLKIKKLVLIILFHALALKISGKSDQTILETDIENDINNALASFDTLLSERWTLDDVERFILFFRMTIRNSHLNKLLLDCKRAILPHVCTQEGLIKKPARDSIKETNNIINQLCNGINHWNKTHHGGANCHCSNTEPLPALGDTQLEKLIISNPINIDLFKIDDLTKHNQFSEANLIIKKYYDKVLEFTSHDEILAIVIAQILYNNRYYKLYNRNGLARVHSKLPPYRQIKKILQLISPQHSVKKNLKRWIGALNAY